MKLKIDVSASPYLSKGIMEHAVSIGIPTWSKISIEMAHSPYIKYIFIQNNQMTWTSNKKEFKKRDLHQEISPIDFFKMTREDFEDEITFNGYPVKFFDDGATEYGCGGFPYCMNFETLEAIYLKAKRMKEDV